MLKKHDAGEAFAPSCRIGSTPGGSGARRSSSAWAPRRSSITRCGSSASIGPGTWVCGYVDDLIAHIPSRRVWEEGGYEGGSYLYEYGRPAFRWAGDVEDRIVATVDRLVKQVRE